MLELKDVVEYVPSKDARSQLSKLIDAGLDKCYYSEYEVYSLAIQVLNWQEMVFEDILIEYARLYTLLESTELISDLDAVFKYYNAIFRECINDEQCDIDVSSDGKLEYIDNDRVEPNDYMYRQPIENDWYTFMPYSYNYGDIVKVIGINDGSPYGIIVSTPADYWAVSTMQIIHAVASSHDIHNRPHFDPPKTQVLFYADDDLCECTGVEIYRIEKIDDKNSIPKNIIDELYTSYNVFFKSKYERSS